MVYELNVTTSIKYSFEREIAAVLVKEVILLSLFLISFQANNKFKNEVLLKFRK